MKPYVGQKVRLSDAGYADLHLKSREEIRQAESMTITSVENINEDSDWEPIWSIEVDQPLINRFLLDWTMVDPI